MLTKGQAPSLTTRRDQAAPPNPKVSRSISLLTSQKSVLTSRVPSKPIPWSCTGLSSHAALCRLEEVLGPSTTLSLLPEPLPSALLPQAACGSGLSFPRGGS